MFDAQCSGFSDDALGVAESLFSKGRLTPPGACAAAAGEELESESAASWRGAQASRASHRHSPCAHRHSPCAARVKPVRRTYCIVRRTNGAGAAHGGPTCAHQNPLCGARSTPCARTHTLGHLVGPGHLVSRPFLV